MGIYINISQRSGELIKKYRVACGDQSQQEFPVVLDLPALLSWLDDTLVIPAPLSPTQEVILFSLRLELLHDLCLSLNGDDPIKKEKASSADKIKFILLTVGGLLVAASEGFDSVVTIMGLSALPSAMILACGTLSACIAIIAFCGFGLIRLSDSLGVKIHETQKILDDSVRQLDEIKQIREKIAAYNLSALSEDELKELGAIAVILEQRFKQLAKTSEHFYQVLHGRQMQGAHFALSGLASLFLFGGAFCAGQTISFNILSLFLVAATPASAPVVLCSLLVGLSAFSIYWALEYSPVATIFGSWFGLPVEKMNRMCDQEDFAQEAKKLAVLKANIHSTGQLKERLSKLEPVSQDSPKTGSNIYRFMPARPAAVNECRLGRDPTYHGTVPNLLNL